MDLFLVLIVGLLIACCVIPMLFMAKNRRKKSDDKPDGKGEDSTKNSLK